MVIDRMKMLWGRAAKFFAVPPVQAVCCMNCGTQLPYKIGFRFRPNKISPCPSCGSTLKLYDMLLTFTVRLYPDLLGRAPAKGKYFWKLKQGYEFFRKTGEWHRRIRIIDRRNNRYYEHIEDAETGKVIRHKDQPLRGHRPEREVRQNKWYRRL